MLTVAQLLTDAREAHAEYRRLAATRSPDKRLPLARAHYARQVAHELDPTHADPAWQADVVPHEDLMAFYATHKGDTHHVG